MAAASGASIRAAGVEVAKVRRETNKQAAQGLRAIVNMDRVVGKVGWFESAHYPGGVPVAYVAAIHEFGSPENNIPPRLGMRATSEEQKPEWAHTSQVVSKAVLANKITPAQAMEVIGLKAAGDVRKHITTVTTPPLKVATVKARLAGKKQGRVVSITIAKPLVRTGELLDSLTNVVESKK